LGSKRSSGKTSICFGTATNFEYSAAPGSE
jgi:hypothetical protein